MFEILTSLSCVVVFIFIIYLIGIIGNKINNIYIPYSNINGMLSKGWIYFITIVVISIVLAIILLVLYIIGKLILYGTIF